MSKTILPELRKNICKKSHIVILGAGASLAAFPCGDKNGRKLPLMNTMVSTLGLTEQLKKDYGHLLNNFEKLYSTICSIPSAVTLKKIIEERTYQYFNEMNIPDTPTLYDYLILSLREKDVIATFNWDPLLMQCWMRHLKFVKHLPQLIFLHGNVAVGTCSICNKFSYLYYKSCPQCRENLEPLPLLYPVENKNYSENKHIDRAWKCLRNTIKNSYYITIFGYSAPTSDVDARKIMLDALVNNGSRPLTEMDIIDVKVEREIRNNWRDFFYSHHYGISKKFEHNYLWHNPRRSCDAHASAYLMNTPWERTSFPKFKTISEMHEWIQPLIKEELEAVKKGIGFRIP